MLKNIFCKKEILLTTAMGLISSLQAAQPVWTYIPLTPTAFTIAPGEVVQIQYLVQNQSIRPKSLVMQAIEGVTPLSACQLKRKGSCLFTLQVDGSQLKKNVLTGPVLCETGNPHQCYRPSPPYNLQLIKNEAPPANANFFVVGSYLDINNILRPLLAMSSDKGQSWIFPSAINAPIFSPTNSNPFNDQGRLISIDCQNQACVSVGDYNLNTNPRPLLATSFDKGLSWIFPDAVTAPVFTPDNSLAFSSGSLFQVSCSGLHCVTVGDYNDTSVTNRPLIGVSHDGGSAWLFPSAPTAPVFTPINTNPFVSGGLGGVSCQANLCVSVGSYSSGGGARPLLAVSQNHGDSWVYPNSTNDPIFTPDNSNAFSTGAFTGVSCFNQTCIGSGTYRDINTDFRAFLAVSQNSGATWVFPSAVNAPVFTPGNPHPYANSGRFNNVSCSAESCIAVGFYSDGSVQRPLLGVSQDMGSTWTFPAAITAPVFTPDNTNAYNQLGVFYHSSCTGVVCIAVGSYNDINNVQRPLLAVSQDRGATWTYPSINAPVFTPSNANAFQSTGVFNKVSCQDSQCVASGNYIDTANIPRLLVAISLDAGKTWFYPSAPTSPLFTPSDVNHFQRLY